MSCQINHWDLEEQMNSLNESQAYPARHFCAGCAYILGLEHARTGARYNPGALTRQDDESQAHPQRHKNPFEAYNLGYYGDTYRQLL